ncbi:MAG: sulfite exporter TauE/SafE family protein [Thermostichales cyanobacterium BF4_bins_65]
MTFWLLLSGGGLVAGILAGFLGIGGGTILVPLMTGLGIPPIQAVATSNLSIVLTATAGTVQNWRMGMLDPKRVLLLGIPALVTAQVGVKVAQGLSPRGLLLAFAGLLLLNLYLVELRRQVTAQAATGHIPQVKLPVWGSRLLTGGLAGLLAGVFGIGGGVIMVPLQIVLLGESIKTAIQTSLGAIVLTAAAATAGHAGLGDWLAIQLGTTTVIRQNVLWLPGLVLGCGGLLGVQVSTRFLPKLQDQMVTLLFRGFLLLLAGWVVMQALSQ